MRPGPGTDRVYAEDRDRMRRAVNAAYPIIAASVERRTADAIAEQIEAERERSLDIPRSKHYSSAWIDGIASGLASARQIARSYNSASEDQR
jgi:hypothetical protein